MISLIRLVWWAATTVVTATTTTTATATAVPIIATFARLLRWNRSIVAAVYPIAFSLSLSFSFSCYNSLRVWYNAVAESGIDFFSVTIGTAAATACLYITFLFWLFISLFSLSLSLSLLSIDSMLSSPGRPRALISHSYYGVIDWLALSVIVIVVMWGIYLFSCVFCDIMSYLLL